jgi:hypothetical protein
MTKRASQSALAAVVAQLRADGQEIDLAGLLDPERPARTPPPAMPPLPPLPDAGGTWLTPRQAELQHAQVWVVKTASGSIVWGQIDGYDTERGKKYWRAITLSPRRFVQVRKVLEGSCPRVGGRRERAKR